MTVTVAGASHQTAAQRGGDAREKDRPLPDVQRDRCAPQALCGGLEAGHLGSSLCQAACLPKRGACAHVLHICVYCMLQQLAMLRSALRVWWLSTKLLFVTPEKCVRSRKLLVSAQCDHGMTAGLRTCCAR